MGTSMIAGLAAARDGLLDVLVGLSSVTRLSFRVSVGAVAALRGPRLIFFGTGSLGLSRSAMAVISFSRLRFFDLDFLSDLSKLPGDAARPHPPPADKMRALA